MRVILYPATESWEISATVKDGVTTLTGTVDSWQEKTLAEKGLVDNDLAVAYGPDYYQP